MSKDEELKKVDKTKNRVIAKMNTKAEVRVFVNPC